MTCKNCMSMVVCDLIMNNSTDNCPCQTCIVKMICMEMCDDFKKKYETIFTFPPTDQKG